MNLKSIIASPATVISDSADGGEPWINPGDAAAGDGDYAFASLFTPTRSDSEWLHATDFSPDLPERGLIVGVEPLVRLLVTRGLTTINDLRLVVNGSRIGNNLASDILIGTAESTMTFGGPHQRAGVALTPETLQSDQFGLALRCNATSVNPFNLARINHLQLRVFYALSIATAFWALLRSRDLITDLVGEQAIYRNHAPRPRIGSPHKDLYVVWRKLTSVPTRHQGGSSGVSQSRIQIDCYGSDPDRVDALAEAVVMSLDGIRGYAGPSGGDTFIHHIRLENEIPGLEGPTDGSDHADSRTTLDFLVDHEESIPLT